MKSFFRFIFGTLTSFAFTIILLLTTVLFQILKPQFLISALDKPEVYQNTQRALRMILKDSLEAEFEKQGLDIEKLTVGERKILNKQINEITDLVTAEKIQDFTEKNIVRVLSYTNGESGKLTLYIPLDKWGFPISTNDQESLSLFTEETDVEKLLEQNEDSPITPEQVKNLYNIREQIYQIWQISMAAFVVLLIIRFFLGKKSLKIHSLGKLIAMLGVSTLATCALSKIASDNVLNDLSRYKHPVQILLGAIATPIVVEIVKLWLIIGSAMLVLGIIIIFISNKLKKDRSTKDTKTKSDSSATKVTLPKNSSGTNIPSQPQITPLPSSDPEDSTKGNNLQIKSEQKKKGPPASKPLAPQPRKG